MQYILGFNPSAPGEQESFHTLTQKLAAQDRYPGCRLVSRRGYYSGVSPSLPPHEPVRPASKRSPDKAGQLFIERSIMAAGPVELDFPGIQFKVTTAEQEDQNRKPQVKIDLQISPTAIEFKTSKGGTVAGCESRFFMPARQGGFSVPSGEHIGCQLSDETCAQDLKTAIPFSASVLLKQKNRILKIAVYDEQSGTLGSKLVRLH